jgi:hypothetical protein
LGGPNQNHKEDDARDDDGIWVRPVHTDTLHQTIINRSLTNSMITKIMLKEYSIGTLEQIGEVGDLEVLVVEAHDSGETLIQCWL